MKSLYHKMIRAFNSGFTHALKHEQRFMAKSNKDNIINESNIDDAIKYLNNPDFGFKGTQEYIDEYQAQLKQMGKIHLNTTNKTQFKETDKNLVGVVEPQLNIDDEIKAKLKKDIDDLQVI